MLKMIAMLDCDECGEPFWKAAPCSDPDPLFWESYVHDLKTVAAMEGWKIGEEEENDNTIICPDCLSQIESENITKSNSAVSG